MCDVVISSYLGLTLDKSRVRGQDVSAVLGSVANNPTGRLLAWRHLQRHWDSVWAMFSTGSFTMGNIIKSVTGHFSEQFDYNQVIVSVQFERYFLIRLLFRWKPSLETRM